MAVSDQQGIIASPVTTVDRTEITADIEAVVALIRRYDVGRIVVGFPRSMDGSVGQQAEKVNTFIEMLKRSTAVPVDVWDERLSTVAANRVMRETGTKRDKQKAQRDAIAAALILQGFLDRLEFQKT